MSMHDPTQPTQSDQPTQPSMPDRPAPAWNPFKPSNASASATLGDRLKDLHVGGKKVPTWALVVSGLLVVVMFCCCGGSLVLAAVPPAPSTASNNSPTATATHAQQQQQVTDQGTPTPTATLGPTPTPTETATPEPSPTATKAPTATPAPTKEQIATNILNKAFNDNIYKPDGGIKVTWTASSKKLVVTLTNKQDPLTEDLGKVQIRNQAFIALRSLWQSGAFAINQINVIINGPTVDQYGNEHTGKWGEADLSYATATLFNWSNLYADTAWDVYDATWMIGEGWSYN